jgi:hypothetical protein
VAALIFLKNEWQTLCQVYVLFKIFFDKKCLFFLKKV